jgi:polyisoprenoid-binding protein YceI
MKNIILSLVVIVVLVFIGYKIMNKGDKKTEEIKKPEVAVEQKKTDNGFEIDTEKSKIAWKGSFVSGIKSHTGTIKVSGNGIFENGNIGNVELRFDMNSIKDNDGNAKLEEHLKSDDFFNSAMYPETKLVLTGLSTTTTADKYNAKANLTIRNITKEITFPIVIKLVDNTINASGKVTFNRADFEVKYGSKSFFKSIGDKAISDTIELDVNVWTKAIAGLTPSNI